MEQYRENRPELPFISEEMLKEDSIYIFPKGRTYHSKVDFYSRLAAKVINYLIGQHFSPRTLGEMARKIRNM